MNIVIQIFIFAVLIVITHTIYQSMVAWRKRMSCTVAMMAAMIIGSMTSLIAGTILALNTNFSINSILAMIIGIGAGIIIGIPFNTMAMLDGMMAGVMGGLMGAMLGEMLLTNYIYVMSLFLLVILAVFVVMLKQVMKQDVSESTRSEMNRKKINSLSFFTALVTVALFLVIMIGTSYEAQTEDHIHIHSNHHMPE